MEQDTEIGHRFGWSMYDLIDEKLQGLIELYYILIISENCTEIFIEGCDHSLPL